MTHSAPMPDSAGQFKDYKPCPDAGCRECKKVGGVHYREWESYCGGYEDYQYRCICGATWWVDGIDS